MTKTNMKKARADLYDIAWIWLDAIPGDEADVSRALDVFLRRAPAQWDYERAVAELKVYCTKLEEMTRDRARELEYR